MKKGCLKGCLTGVLIFIGLCFLLTMCSAILGIETDPTPTGPIDDSTTMSTNPEESTTEYTTTPTVETIHTHSFSGATCTAPMTCSCGATEGEALGHTWTDATCTAPKTCSCGATEGNANGHDWKDATCQAPKTCKICKETSGSTGYHSYANGKCKVCNTPDPSDPNNITVWIPTNGGKKYHNNPSCSKMKNPKETTKAKAEKAGYDACARCY